MADVKTWWLDADAAIPKFGNLPAAANSVYEGGRLAWSDASGNAIPSSAATATSKCWGFYLSHIDNSTATPGPGNSGLAGGVPGGIPYGAGVALLLGDGTVTEANVGAYVYLSSDSGTTKPTVSLSDAGGTRPLVGYVFPYVRSSSDVDPSAIPVAVGLARPDALDPELAQSSTAFTARAVATSIQAYSNTGTGLITETSNGALATQDGVSTLAVNDVIFFPHGLSNVQNADVGPWQIVSLGGASAKWQLRRPDWWVHGTAIPLVAIIRIGPEGTAWPMSTWRATTTGTIDTTDPLFYPDKQFGTGAVGTQVTGLYARTGAVPTAVDATAAAAVKAVLAAGNGTGTLDFTGTGTDVIKWSVINF